MNAPHLSTPTRPLPKHVAIIMDGNGRWAQQRGKPRVFGHAEGARAVRDTVESAARLGLRHLTLYAFSIANWSRPQSEVDALMRLFIDFARSEEKLLKDNGISVSVAGCLTDLPQDTQEAVGELIARTSCGTHMNLTLAVSYGARRDLLAATRRLAERALAGELATDAIDEEALRSEMSTSHLPDVDLLIRTGGEQRLSDFLLFEAAYAELVFLPLMWPEFRAEHLEDAVADFCGRQRRFGRVGEQIEPAPFLQATDLRPARSVRGTLDLVR